MEHSILEMDLANELGLTKDEIRELRKKHLAAGEFALGKRGMMIAEAGAARIRAALGAPEKKGAADLPGLETKPSTETADEKKGAAANIVAELKTLWVKSCPLNKRIVLATLTPDLMGDVVRVRVKSNENFVPHMKIHAVAESETLYRLAGRCPRYRGRF